jgi:hypothetical protein
MKELLFTACKLTQAGVIFCVYSCLYKILFGIYRAFLFVLLESVLSHIILHDITEIFCFRACCGPWNRSKRIAEQLRWQSLHRSDLVRLLGKRNTNRKSQSWRSVSRYSKKLRAISHDHFNSSVSCCFCSCICG